MHWRGFQAVDWVRDCESWRDRVYSLGDTLWENMLIHYAISSVHLYSMLLLFVISCETHVTTLLPSSKNETTHLLPIACMTTQNDRDVKKHLGIVIALWIRSSPSIRREPCNKPMSLSSVCVLRECVQQSLPDSWVLSMQRRVDCDIKNCRRDKPLG